MRIVDLLNKESILLNASPASKQEAIDMLVDLQVNGGRIADKEAYKKGILAREEMSSTAVGKELRFHMRKVRLSRHRPLQQ